MTSQTSTSKLMNIMARIRFVLAMVKVCKFYILVLLTFPHLTEISLFLISYTFLTFKRIYFQLINLLMIIRFSLNFTLIFFVLRIYIRASYFFKVPVKEVSTRGPPSLLSNLPLLPSLVKKSPYINGTIVSVILPPRWFVIFCPSIAFL
jgi:hypothetical protein